MKDPTDEKLENLDTDENGLLRFTPENLDLVKQLALPFFKLFFLDDKERPN